jgi:hypothetical protein
VLPALFYFFREGLFFSFKTNSKTLAYVIQLIYLCSVIKTKEIMTDLNKANRADLEIAILENDLDETLFGGLDNVIAMDTEEIREKLINWVIEGNEATCE